MSVQDVYNFEKAFETAAGNLCATLGLTAFSSQGKHILNQDGSFSFLPIDLQRDRPRVEIIFTRGGSASGGSAGRLAIVNPGDDYSLHRIQAWQGSFDFSVVTDPRPDIHFSYLATVRNFLATLPAQLNAYNQAQTAKLYLPNHHLHHPMVDAGETHRYDSKSKFYITTIRESFVFSILPTAWALLNSP